MAARRLAGYVRIGGVLYGPGSDVPEDVAKKITNPKAWETEPESEGDPEPATEPESATEVKAAGRGRKSD